MAPRYRGRETGRRSSPVKRGTSGTGDRISTKARDGTPIGGPRSAGHFNIRAGEKRRCCADDRMMRSGKTEDAMSTSGVVSIAGRQLRSALAVVETQLESNCVISRACRKRKSAERNQKALCGDGIRDSDADQRAQQAPGCCVPPEHTASHTVTLSPVPSGTKAAFVQLSADRDIWATAPKSQEVYAPRGSGAQNLPGRDAC